MKLHGRHSGAGEQLLRDEVKEFARNQLLVPKLAFRVYAYPNL
jgi:hypothetical protein